MRTINALGFIEVYGLVAGIEAADAMLKSANVRILREHGVNPGLISVVVEGDLAACRAAVNAGVAAASRLGTVVASHVIGRPDTDTENMILDMLRESAPREKESGIEPPQTGPSPAQTTAVQRAEPKTKPVAPSTTPPSAKSAEKQEQEQGTTGAKAPAPARGKFGEVLAYISGSKRGYSLKELRTRFPGLPQQVRKQLDAAVASGELLKIGARYRKPEAKE